MKKFISISFLSLFAFAVSCSSNDDNDFNNQEKEVILNNSNQTNRLNTAKAGVISIKEAPDEDPELTSSKLGVAYKTYAANINDVASNIPLVQIAEVSAPVHNGTTLRATHVVIHEKYAYVSYNVEGPTYLGAIDVIDISDPNNPSIALGAIFPNTDVSAISYYNDALYIAGASSSTNIDESNPAVLIKMQLEDGLPTDNIVLINMSSYVATDVLANTNGIYGVSGVNGVLAKYDISNQLLQESVSVNDLRAIGEYDNKIVVLSGTDGVSVYNSSTLSEISNFPTSTDIPESKRTIDFYDNNILVAEGKKGLGIYNIDNGSPVNTIESPTITDNNIDPNEVVTNAVTVEKDHIFMANGAAGLTVHDLKKGISNITKTGTLDIDGSTNYVQSANGYIFVASGKGGLKIIKTVEDNPNSGETSIVCDGPEFTTYNGGSWLNINSNESKYYSGSTSLQGLNVNANLTFCGSLAVSNGLNINSNGHFKMSGSLAQGNYNNKYLSLNINDNAILELEGSMVVYGNMTFNTGANLKVSGSVTIYGDVMINNNVTIDFIGSDSSITIYGTVTKNGTPTITGNYNDTLNKL